MLSINELISSVALAGTIGSIAIPEITLKKEESFIKMELASASIISKSLEALQYTQMMQKGNFDWDGDGVVNNTSKELSNAGYPWDLSNHADAVGAITTKGSQSGFTEQSNGLLKDERTSYRLYTAIASDPQKGLLSDKKDVSQQPDKNDFWIYVPQIDGKLKNGCIVSSNHSKSMPITNGSFVLIDIQGKQKVDFVEKDLGINFNINCS